MIRCVALSPAVDTTYAGVVLTLATINRPTQVHRRAGGKGVNVARAVRALSGEAVVAGIVGGPTGDWFRQLAAAEGLRLDLVDGGDDTRLCLTLLDRPGHPTEVYEPSSAVTAHAWAQLVEREEVADARWTVLSGSVPPGVDAADLAALCNATGTRRLALDVHGETAETALRAGVGATVVKVNREEAAQLTRQAVGAPPEELCLVLSQRSGAELTVVTCGGEGSVAADSAGAVWRVAYDGPRGDHPTGSGDAFLAGLVQSLDRGSGITGALRDATAAGGANAHAATAGALDPALVRRCREAARVVPVPTVSPSTH